MHYLIFEQLHSEDFIFKEGKHIHLILLSPDRDAM
jgi:hypothetical protein